MPSSAVRAKPWIFFIFIWSLLNILSQLPIDEEQNTDNDHHNDSHEDRRAGQLLVVQALEHIVHEMLQQIQRVVGVIACQQIHLPEHLEGVDHRQNRNKQNGGGQIRHLDAEEGAERTGTVQGRRLRDLLGDARQGGHEEDHIVSHVLPQIEKHDGQLAEIAFEPVDGGAAPGDEPFVDHAVVVEQNLPDQHDGGDGHHQRADEDRAEQALHGDLLHEEDSKQKGDDHRQRHGDQGKGGRIGRGPPEGRILKQGNEIGQPHEIARYGVIHQAVVDHHKERCEKKYADADQAGHKKPPGAAHLFDSGCIPALPVGAAVGSLLFGYFHHGLFSQNGCPKWA